VDHCSDKKKHASEERRRGKKFCRTAATHTGEVLKRSYPELVSKGKRKDVPTSSRNKKQKGLLTRTKQLLLVPKKGSSKKESFFPPQGKGGGKCKKPLKGVIDQKGRPECRKGKGETPGAEKKRCEFLSPRLARGKRKELCRHEEGCLDRRTVFGKGN